MSHAHAATGEQFTLSSGVVDATITELAAGLRELRVDGVDLVESYGLDTISPQGAGIVLVPWPNRVEDGAWSLDGVSQQLDLTEPSLHNASHGLLRNTGYRVIERSADAITLGAGVFPQHGYPFRLDTSVRYALEADGIRVTHEIRNLSDRSAPVAIGTHPYLRVGAADVADLTVTIDASQHLVFDERLIPRSTHQVDAATDLRGGARVGDLELNDAYTGIPSGTAHRLTAPDGTSTELWADDAFGYLQVFTSRVFPSHIHPADGAPRLAIAIEPMTAPPNALASGEGLVWVEPGASFSASWGIRYRSGS